MKRLSLRNWEVCRLELDVRGIRVWMRDRLKHREKWSTCFGKCL